MNLNLNWIKQAAKGAVTFSKKNRPSIMIGGSIIGFWVTAILVAKEAPNAQKEIEYEENKRKEDEKEPLNVKDKAVIYGKHCWIAGACGVVSTGLAIGAHKIDLSRLAEMYMLTQFYRDDSDKLRKAILKKPDGEKELASLKNDIIENDYPEEDYDKWVPGVPGEGTTLFIDTVTGVKWKGNIVDVMNGITQFNQHMRTLYNQEFKRELPFAVCDGSPHYNGMEDINFCAKEEMNVFLEDIGEAEGLSTTGLGDLLEFRAYRGDSDLLRPNDILTYKKYMDPDNTYPVLCYIDYREYLAPSSELLARYPS